MRDIDESLRRCKIFQRCTLDLHLQAFRVPFSFYSKDAVGYVVDYYDFRNFENSSTSNLQMLDDHALTSRIKKTGRQVITHAGIDDYTGLLVGVGEQWPVTLKNVKIIQNSSKLIIHTSPDKQFSPDFCNYKFKMPSQHIYIQLGLEDSNCRHFC